MDYAVGTDYGRGFGRIFRTASFEPPKVGVSLSALRISPSGAARWWKPPSRSWTNRRQPAGATEPDGGRCGTVLCRTLGDAGRHHPATGAGRASGDDNLGRAPTKTRSRLWRALARHHARLLRFGGAALCIGGLLLSSGRGLLVMERAGERRGRAAEQATQAEKKAGKFGAHDAVSDGIPLEDADYSCPDRTQVPS